jgi:hypothetical protein
MAEWQELGELLWDAVGSAADLTDFGAMKRYWLIVAMSVRDQG